VGGAGGGQPGANVQELPDAALTGQVTYHAAQERTVGPRPGDHLRALPDHRFGGPPVGREMVLAPQPVVIDPGRVRNGGVKPHPGAGGSRRVNDRPDSPAALLGSEGCSRKSHHPGGPMAGPCRV